MPVSSVFQSVSRPTTSSVAVQPLSIPVNVSGTSPQRPVAGCLSTQQMPGSSLGMSQPVSRPVTVPVTTQPVSRNITVPVVAQPVSRPVTTLTAEPVILDQVNFYSLKLSKTGVQLLLNKLISNMLSQSGNLKTRTSL